ncbi:MAG: SGNH/GDSL hydrolase family protein, partial [Bacteroidota bacterium]
EAGFGNRLALDMTEDCLGETSLGPGPFPESPSPQNFLSIADQGPFHNMGVPGAKSFHLLAEGYGQLNPYFGRFASGDQTNVMTDAMQAQPTFFTAWIGNNDVLGYAMAGGETDSITSEAMFTQALGGILQTLTSGGAKGAIANIPSISDIAFFNTIPYNAITVSAEEAEALNGAYAEYNADAEQFGVDPIAFSEGPNPMIIQDENIPQEMGHMRQIKEGERVLLSLPQDSLKCAGWGSQKPVPAHYVLDVEELTEINAAVNNFNAIIQNMASEYALAHVDINAKMQEAENEIRFDGVGYTLEFVSGGLFSIDGVHLTGQGYALVANEFVLAINDTYGATIPTVSVTDYPGIRFP